ncbi:CPBP family intramembrane metalloprotease [Micrococcales bacterium 31B]|nr:CPBP family intramembrane metalloprotease [Micrococcales bacterium 31B]
MISTVKYTPLETQPTWHWGLLPALLVSASGFFLYAWGDFALGYGTLALGLGSAFLMVGRGAAPAGLATDLSLISLGLVIVSLTSVAAKLGWLDLLRIGGVLAAAVIAPFVVDRFVLRRRVVSFSFRGGEPWGRYHAGYIGAVLLVGYFVLPFYFFSTGTYLNWPVVDSSSLLARLFVGVNAVGLWDELFFICTVFVLLRRNFVFWQANLLQAIVFVSFLWELGYRSWGPLLTIPFALVQGLIFNRTRSLPYVVTVHLLFDAFVFLVIARAHNPSWPNLFVWTG